MQYRVLIQHYRVFWVVILIAYLTFTVMFSRNLHQVFKEKFHQFEVFVGVGRNG